MRPPQAKAEKDFETLAREACERFRALPLEKQREMRRAQRKSWVVGETMLAHPEMSRAEAEKLFDGVVGC